MARLTTKATELGFQTKLLKQFRHIFPMFNYRPRTLLSARLSKMKLKFCWNPQTEMQDKNRPTRYVHNPRNFRCVIARDFVATR